MCEFEFLYHGLGLGGSNGVFTPLPTFTTLLSMSKLLMDSLLGDRVFVSDAVGGCNRLWFDSFELCIGCEFGIVSWLRPASVICFLINGDLRPTSGEYFSKLSVDRDRGVHETPLSIGELRSNLIGLRSSRMGVVSSDVKQFLPLWSSRLIVGLSTKLSELHSSDVGETSGVSVVGVTDPGRKNASMPSPIACADISVTSGRVGARVFGRFGRPLTKWFNCDDALGNSVIESQFSPLSLFCEWVELREFCVSSKSGIWPTLRFSTTDCGRTLCANERRFGSRCGVAYLKWQ